MRRSALRIGIVITPVIVLCIPSVFRAVVNSIAYTANWVSFRIGWDWHRVSPHFVPERDILLKSPPPTHWSVWLVLALIGADVLAMVLAPWMLKHGSSAQRSLVRLFFGVNAAVFSFFVLVLALRLGLGYLKSSSEQSRDGAAMVSGDADADHSSELTVALDLNTVRVALGLERPRHARA